MADIQKLKLNVDGVDTTYDISVPWGKVTGQHIPLSAQSASVSSSGWYKIAIDNKNTTQANAIIDVKRTYNNANNETYTFLINCSYSGNTNITQLGGKANSQIITKIAVYNPPHPYDRIIYIYYNSTTNNTINITCSGDFTAVSPVAETIKTSYITELDINSFGFKTNGDIVGDLSGTATYSSRLGTSSAYYTKSSLDTALNGKANSSHGTHVTDGAQTWAGTKTFSSKIGFGVYGARFDSDVRSTWRSSIFGENTNNSFFRTIRTDKTITDFSEIYGSGISWSTGDTHGYLSVSYGATNGAWIGGGSGNGLGWSATLLHSGNYSTYAAAKSHTHTKSQITDFPTIPTNTNQLTNGAGFITGITKSMVTTALGYTPPTSDTNTWRGITDSVSTTDSTISASATAVKTAYDKANHSHPYLSSGVVNVTTSTSTPTRSGAPFQFATVWHNHDSSNKMYQQWISGYDLINSYGYGVTVNMGIYRDPGYSSGGYYISQGWDGGIDTYWYFNRYGQTYFPGDIYAPSFYQSSDERLKTFHDPIKVDLEKLKKLRKNYFKFNDKDKLEIGVSAQEIQQLYPEIVSSDDNGYLSVAYDKLSVIALSAIDKLDDDIKELKQENNDLKDQLSTIKNILKEKGIL